MDKDKVDYILKYFDQLMNKNEVAAWKHWSVNYKIIHSNSSNEEKDARIKVMTERGWLSTDEDILNLLAEGIDKFRENTAKRI
ncbi:MAG: hypothetical protein GY827_08040 [Cytophagales bacterium]|nr:hypothetical protein [Cytophagales bacterium]